MQNTQFSNTNLVVIDASVADYEILAKAIIPDAQVVILESDRDGIKQITAALQNPQFSSIHIVSHGSPGCLYLGNTQLSLDTLNYYTPQLKSWLTKEIILYGCNVAYGDAGEEFVTKLHQITGAGIAATSSLTGNSTKGGNWDLEVIRGEVNQSFVFTDEVRAAYTGVLETIIVNTLEDEDNGVTVGGVSLRDAINRANALPGKDTIEFDPNLSRGVINLAEQLSISDDLAIKGLGLENLIISGNSESNVLNINDSNWSQIITVDIEGLTISDGRTGILNYENLNLSNVKISNNNASGINSRGESLTITNSSISNNNVGGIQTASENNIITDTIIFSNSSHDDGGGINLNGVKTIIIRNSIISDNSSRGSGGGIKGSPETFTITNSTISGNSSTWSGGGISTSNINIINSTISGNSSNSPVAQGGGISSGYANIINSTITNNNAQNQGSGISVSQLTIANSIISGNSNNQDIHSGSTNPKITSKGGNIIGLGSAAKYFDQPGDLVAVEDPGLEELADNGGSTLTHALKPDSPAVDAGINELVPLDITTDQRGTDRIVNGRVDAGAFELDPDFGKNLVENPDTKEENDKLKGTSGDDEINGLGGKDTLKGGKGEDTLDGGEDKDKLLGGKGDDLLDGGGR